jgi:3-hydroxyethyl bacteriochlorophyllide a dehydrogenase
MASVLAVVIPAPGELALRTLPLTPAGPTDALVRVAHTGISTGTERLLFTGRMPPFPGLSYPLVPGYETVGTVLEADPGGVVDVGDRVFVPGAACYEGAAGLFGGAASQVRVPAEKLVRLPEDLPMEEGVLFALAATAAHALVETPTPELIVGHGVLGRLLARLAVAHGGSPVVWEKDPVRAEGAEGYTVRLPEDDPRRDYGSIVDVSGDPSLVDTLVGRLAKGGEIVLAGFYADRLSFAFPLAFMKEARFRIAAEWRPEDLERVLALLAEDRLSLGGLITHRHPQDEAEAAYETAFGDPACLKMILDWRT